MSWWRIGLCTCQPVSLQIFQLNPDQHAPLAAVYIPACPAEAADPVLLGPCLRACHILQRSQCEEVLCRYGLVYPGVGWVVWRNRSFVDESLVRPCCFCACHAAGLFHHVARCSQPNSADHAHGALRTRQSLYVAACYCAMHSGAFGHAWVTYCCWVLDT